MFELQKSESLLISFYFNFQGENGRIAYTVRGSDSVPTYSTSYFYVNPETGIVYVTKALTDDNQRPTRYVVCDILTFYYKFHFLWKAQDFLLGRVRYMVSI